MTQALVKEPAAREPLDHRVAVSGNWEKFKLMQQVAEDSPGVKLAYFAGAIEILMPGFGHESFHHKQRAEINWLFSFDGV